MATDAFARDLGYLDQFFAKLDAHAANLPPDAGGRLRTLMGEERARWREIRGLLGASASAATAPATSDARTVGAAPATSARAARPAPQATVSAPPHASSTPSPSAARFTVGSLIARDR